MITHHPSAELQFDYSTGTLKEPFALAVACHVALCDLCSARLADMNAQSGRISGQGPSAERTDKKSDYALTASDCGGGQRPLTPIPSLDAQTMEMIPDPLRQYLSYNLADIPWQHVSEGMEEFRLETNSPGYRISLVRLKPGCELPTHTHTKEELTVVLAGGYADGKAHFERGDFSHLDSHITHNPIADPDGGCLALGVLSGPIELTGLMGALLNPLLRF